MNKLEGNKQEIKLSNSRVDYVVSAAKAALGSVPFAGSLFIAIAGNIIPNQRIDRIEKFAKSLQTQLSEIEESVVQANLSNENFTDLIEESLRQAARSLSDERRNYIATLVANSIKSNDIEYFESKHLLKILGEINDIEVIWLRYYLYPNKHKDLAFRKKHSHIITTIQADWGFEQIEFDKTALQISYKEHLASLGLLKKEVDISISHGKSNLQTIGYRISGLGGLLLRELGLFDKKLDNNQNATGK
jgi:hypothetical protein